MSLFKHSKRILDIFDKTNTFLRIHPYKIINTRFIDSIERNNDNILIKCHSTLTYAYSYEFKINAEQDKQLYDKYISTFFS